MFGILKFTVCVYNPVYTNSKFKDPKHIKPYPNLKKHLDKFEQVITASSGNKPYGIHRARNERRRCFCRSFWLGGFYRPNL
jgi:hypothetical protein